MKKKYFWALHFYLHIIPSPFLHPGGTKSVQILVAHVGHQSKKLETKKGRKRFRKRE